MPLFDEIWRESVTPMLQEQFGSSTAAEYYDGSEVLRGTFDVLLGPEEAVQDPQEQTRQQIRYRRTATFSWVPDSPFWETAIVPSGRVVITENEAEVTYSIAGVLSRSPSAVMLILQRGGTQRQWKAQG